MFVRVAKFTKQVPTSPGWLSYPDLVEVLQQTLVIPPEMRDEDTIGIYIFHLQLLFSRLAEIPSATYLRFEDGDEAWTTLSIDDAAAFTTVDALPQMPAFLAARDALLAKLRVDVQVFPIVETQLTNEQLTLENVKAMVA